MAKKQNPQILSPENYIRQRARHLPLFKCLVNEGWDDAGMAEIIIARRHINGNITFCSYLVDLQCLGIKDTLFDFNIPEDQFDEVVVEMSQGDALIEAGYPLVHNIIHAGWEYAEEIGFKPHKDFISTTQFMLEEDNEAIPIIEIDCGDDDGIPVYVQGPLEDDARANMIISQLEKNVGDGNYRFILYDEDESEGVDNDDLPSDGEDWDEDDEWIDDDEMIFFREYAVNSYDENARIFLELSQYLDEERSSPDVNEEEDNEEEDENFTRLKALTDLLYLEIIPGKEMETWLERWSAEASLYSVSEEAAGIMMGSPPYLTAMEIQRMDYSPLRSEKTAAALALFPDYALLRIEERMNRIMEQRLSEDDLPYESVFGDRDEITPVEYVRLQAMRLAFFVATMNFAGMESLFFSVEDEFDFNDEEQDEDLADFFSLFLSTRIALLRKYLLSPVQE